LIGAKAADSIELWGSGGFATLGRQKAHALLFYEFDLETHIPSDHLLRGIDRFLDPAGLHEEMRGFYSHTGRPSIDPELMIRMLVVGYVLGLRSERRLPAVAS
jgi:transposase